MSLDTFIFSVFVCPVFFGVDEWNSINFSRNRPICVCGNIVRARESMHLSRKRVGPSVNGVGIIG